jgi:membrane-associated phospholipid phosphatase
VALSVGNIMTVTVAVAVVVLLAIFSLDKGDKRVPLRKIPREFLANRYYIHAAVFPAMAALKLLVDRFNDPLKGLRGDYTQVIHRLEGNLVRYLQYAMETPILTAILNFHYLFIYALLFVLAPAYFMYVRERDLADKAMLNYIVIYVLAIPYYLFLNVDVTSTFIPGMKALLYQHSALYFDFFATSDPLDNAFPSLHMAIPFGLLFIHYLHCHQQGTTLRKWSHWPLHVFIASNTAVFMFSILYLGIHWITDIFAGIILAGIGALAVHTIHPHLRRDRRAEFTPHKIRGFHITRSTTFLFVILLAIPLFTFEGDTTVERPNMQLGPGDVKADIIGPVPAEGEILLQVTNLGTNHSVEALFVRLEEVPDTTQDGRINWTALSANRSIGAIPPGATLSLKATEAETMHVLLVHDPREAPENATAAELSQVDASPIQVRATYPNGRLTESLFMSIPSFIITGAVLHRQWQLRRAGLSWSTDRRLE